MVLTEMLLTAPELLGVRPPKPASGRPEYSSKVVDKSIYNLNQIMLYVLMYFMFYFSLEFGIALVHTIDSLSTSYVCSHIFI